MDTISVRPATQQDLPRLLEILNFGARGRYEDVDNLEPYARALEEIQSSGTAMTYVAELEGQVVGTCQLLTFRHLHNQGGLCAELEAMHVHPDVRNQGIGAQLLKDMLEEARTRGCYRVQLTSQRERLDAHRFYVTNGFDSSHVGFKVVF